MSRRHTASPSAVALRLSGVKYTKRYRKLDAGRVPVKNFFISLRIGDLKLKVDIIKANIEDVQKLIEVQNQSFYDDYIKYGECPGYNHTVESMTNIIENRFTYKIVYENEIIGDIIVKKNSCNNYYLGCICVIPYYQNKGIGNVAISFIEQQFPNAENWTLETPSDKEVNHHFYKKLGYVIVKEYLVGKVKIALFEKKTNNCC
ncbi:GNAT family N-acetyltransferase [Herbivorax sp. ANBcel31]|uniref:GNAT family N-acetyltransferase n=1 Tax=Herbivorax sp. ANBcel31 TaxID=3069754 RepID=UPI0027B1F1BE|nr:GNAT family N-acetyltransferase [Herbivorax sp. ANBcel31]MDQ2088121.1 GNAT family N-acetyltransferase [Herbivorax sp. ANBcel31]